MADLKYTEKQFNDMMIINEVANIESSLKVLALSPHAIRWASRIKQLKNLTRCLKEDVGDNLPKDTKEIYGI